VSPAHATFGAKQAPDFSISVVSTQRAACPINVGSLRLALVIKQGKAKLWSSADCPSGARSSVVRLRRGVPEVIPITWRRQTASPGCNGIPARVPSGTYTAYAVEGPLTSAPDRFRLG
jgi:hypothetical protein